MAGYSDSPNQMSYQYSYDSLAYFISVVLMGLFRAHFILNSILSPIKSPRL